MRHPLLSNRERLIIWWLVWLFLTLGQLMLYYFAYGSFSWISVPDGIISMLIYSGIGISLWYPFKYFNTGESRIPAVISNLVISGAIAIALWVLITKLLDSFIIPEKILFQAYWDATFPYRIGTGVFIYALIVLAYYLFISLSNLSDKNAKEARLESL